MAHSSSCQILLALLVIAVATAQLASSHKVNIVQEPQNVVGKTRKLFDRSGCDNVKGFTRELRSEIKSKQPIVKQIADYVLAGPERHKTYDELARLCDGFGPRMSGSKSLERAIRHMHQKLLRGGKLDVRAEPAMIPHWEIGTQYAFMTAPRRHRMSILALGYSVGTNSTEGIEADVQVVRTFDELEQLGKAGALRDKIVVYNYKFTTYGDSVKYRTGGALRAAKYGALAALVRSVGPFSIYSAHAGAGSRSIPTAAITLEDADLIQRWTDRQKQVRIRLRIDAKNYDDVPSFNLIGDLRGKDKPDEVVLVSGHIDSWYNTQGAMDDGGGMMISYKAVDVLRKLDLQPRRTLRAALWVAEEFGLIGAQAYYKQHKNETNKFMVVMESDLGTFAPLGLSYTNIGPVGRCIVAAVLDVIGTAINTTQLDTNYEGSDIEVFTDQGVPGLSLANDNGRYFWFHHTSGDSMTIENPDDLDRTTILWAASSYMLADLSQDVDLRN